MDDFDQEYEESVSQYIRDCQNRGETPEQPSRSLSFRENEYHPKRTVWFLFDSEFNYIVRYQKHDNGQWKQFDPDFAPYPCPNCNAIITPVGEGLQHCDGCGHDWAPYWLDD